MARPSSLMNYVLLAMGATIVLVYLKSPTAPPCTADNASGAAPRSHFDAPSAREYEQSSLQRAGGRCVQLATVSKTDV